MANSETPKEPEVTAQWWIPIWELLVHVIVGTFLFLLIALPALLLSLWMDSWHLYLDTKPIIFWTLTAVEYFILGSDFLLFAIFMVRSVKRTIRAL
jgi:hypothetical protein